MLSALVQAHAIEIVLIESALFDLCSPAANCDLISNFRLPLRHPLCQSINRMRFLPVMQIIVALSLGLSQIRDNNYLKSMISPGQLCFLHRFTGHF